MKIPYKRYIRSMPHPSFGKKGKNKTKGQPWAMGWGFGKNRQAQHNPISNGQMVKLGAYFLQPPSLCVGLFCFQIICKILSWMLALKSSRTLDSWQFYTQNFLANWMILLSIGGGINQNQWWTNDLTVVVDPISAVRKNKINCSKEKYCCCRKYGAKQQSTSPSWVKSSLLHLW